MIIYLALSQFSDMVKMCAFFHLISSVAMLNRVYEDFRRKHPADSTSLLTVSLEHPG